MKSLRVILVIMVILSLVLTPALVLAAKQHEKGTDQEGPSPARKVWDTTWRLINFGILAYFIVRYGRQPIKNFLAQHSSEIGERLNRADELKAQAESEYQQAEARMLRMEELIEEIRTYMKSEAERQQREIVADAERESTYIMSEAKERAQARLLQAKESVKAELVEMALSEAEKIIRERINAADRLRMVKDCLGQLVQPASAA